MSWICVHAFVPLYLQCDVCCIIKDYVTYIPTLYINGNTHICMYVPIWPPTYVCYMFVWYVHTTAVSLAHPHCSIY